mmetsp:Transcript_30123/g.46023  ORF Transcript_30123/g.46023 Transcript_30123/m.46023 type:complete len:94 (+) Transcript_30123:1012-1293(+)|eukprot:CAMPEP_0170490728 /NCGR_PEP_ID=MMETSP0208-20121228/8820_1 /TAXON_ID=197538 /ORGANISM="Strombidium inclinatum, Strain S3" /LENGTH=93 /DNA_ID=CAMNT_0010766169 /DNA_START=2268 /DNA_END=2549 /DNA_ORIENTATION=-
MQTADEEGAPKEMTTLLVSLKSPPAEGLYFQNMANSTLRPPDPVGVSLDLRKHCLYEDSEGAKFTSTEDLASIEGFDLIEESMDIVPLRQKIF